MNECFKINITKKKILTKNQKTKKFHHVNKKT